MDRWTGVLKIPSASTDRNFYRVAASLCLASNLNSLDVPSANVIFFHGDRVQGTSNLVIDRLSNLQNVASVLVSKFGKSVNAWVIEASVFNGPFAVYKSFIPSVNRFGEPKSYNPVGFPASSSTVTLLSNFLKEVNSVIVQREKRELPANLSASTFSQPKTIILGFSKGGTVINQLVTELSFSEPQEWSTSCGISKILPNTRESLLDSISEIHYIDVGLNSTGAYINDPNVIEQIFRTTSGREMGLSFFLHGTPRQWCDKKRDTIRTEKDKLVELLELKAKTSGSKLQLFERFYFADRRPDLQMHFEIIEAMDVSRPHQFTE